MNQIQSQKEYSLKEIHDLRLIPWAKHYQTIRKVINSDLFAENILRTTMSGKGRLTRYAIKGSNIIKYVNKYSPALMRMVYRQKCKTK